MIGLPFFMTGPLVAIHAASEQPDIATYGVTASIVAALAGYLVNALDAYPQLMDP